MPPPCLIVRHLLAWVRLVLYLGLLAVPAAFQLVAWDQPPDSAANRLLAPVPALPRSLRDALGCPRQVDAWLMDHFGGRDALLRENARRRRSLFDETPTRQTLFGADGRLFLTNHDAAQPYVLIEEVCGIGVTPARVARAAEDITDLLSRADRIAPGAVFAIIPSAPAPYHNQLPEWLRRGCQGPTTAMQVLDHLRPNPAIAAQVAYPLAPLRVAEGT